METTAHSSPILNTYVSQPNYFQRMLEFLLQSRFRTVHFFLKGQKEWMYFSVDGRILDSKNHKNRFETFTDWYNSVKGTHFPLWYTDIFKDIYVTGRLSIADILETVTQREIAEFRDIKYLSSIAHGYIFRRLKMQQIPCAWDRKQTFSVEWKDRTYAVTHLGTTNEEGYPVYDFLQAICSEEKPIRGLYYMPSKEKRILISDVESEDVEGGVDEVDESEDVEGTVEEAVAVKEFTEEPIPHPVIETVEVLRAEMEKLKETHTKEIAGLHELIRQLQNSQHTMSVILGNVIQKQMVQQPHTVYPVHVQPLQPQQTMQSYVQSQQPQVYYASTTSCTN